MHPILLKIGLISIKSYGFMLMIAFLAGLFWANKEAKREGIKFEQLVDLTLYIIIGGVVLARLVHVFLEYKHYSDYPVDILKVWSVGGLSFHGGVLGGVIATVLYAKRHNIHLWKLADMLTPSLALGYAIGRIGCFLNGCCYGVPTKLPWGVKFAGATSAVHPTQLYASAAGLILFFVTLHLGRAKKYDGQIFYSFLIFYSLYRFLIELLRRGASAKLLLDGLTQAQIASVVIIIGSVVMLRFLSSKKGI